jgi:HrpA-like RNA helicase
LSQSLYAEKASTINVKFKQRAKNSTRSVYLFFCFPAQTQSHPEHIPSGEITLDIPQNYDRRYRINLCLLSRDAEDFIKHGRLVDYDVDRELTRERVRQFRGILQHYLDFCQKEKFKKLRKIRSDQKTLPIYQYKDKVVEMVRQHQIVVVAGDTGCGKSTQVQSL